MDELNKIIDRYTEGNYLIGKTAKEEMAKDILALFNVSQQRELLKAYDHFAEQKHCWYLGTEDDTKEEFLKANNCG